MRFGCFYTSGTIPSNEGYTAELITKSALDGFVHHRQQSTQSSRWDLTPVPPIGGAYRDIR
jgi:hypothetical protein